MNNMMPITVCLPTSLKHWLIKEAERMKSCGRRVEIRKVPETRNSRFNGVGWVLWANIPDDYDKYGAGYKGAKIYTRDKVMYVKGG